MILTFFCAALFVFASLWLFQIQEPPVPAWLKHKVDMVNNQCVPADLREFMAANVVHGGFDKLTATCSPRHIDNSQDPYWDLHLTIDDRQVAQTVTFTFDKLGNLVH